MLMYCCRSSSPSVGSPLSPSPGDGPVSFRKNVNRAKTKRWVEAKQYSYDGDDWGDDDYDEYDDTPPVPPPPHLNPSNAGASDSFKPAAVEMDRSRSLDQVTTRDSFGSRNDGSRWADANSASTDTNAAFIRPADIYRRAQDQMNQPEQLQDNGRPNEASQPVGQSVPDPNPPPPYAPGVADGDDRGLHRPINANQGNPESEQFQDSANSIKAREVPVLGFPDVKRLSGSGADALGQSDTSSSQPERPPLQHSNSAGFRSAVQQAFDVAEVPSSAADSVARSNSDSASAISPIIPSRTVSDQKTPTIVEEPRESFSQPVGTNQTIPFKPGHRRDLSLPSSDSTPSRKPEINLGEQGPPSANAEMSTPEDGSHQDYFQLKRPPVERSEFSDQGPHDDLPAPLRFGGDAPTGTIENNTPVGNPSVIVPSISCDTETSPEDTENDRLREEIIRSLSRENSPSSGPERDSRPTTRGDNLNPNDYDGTRSEGGRSAREPEADQPPVSRPKTFDEILGGDPAPVEQPKPRLTRRFSWESSSSEELPPTGAFQPPSQTPDYLAQPLPSEIAAQARSEPVPEYSAVVNDEDAQSPVEKPKLTVIPPSTIDDNSTSDRLPEVYDDAAFQDSGAAARELVPITAPPPAVEPTLLGFRDILGIKSSNERVQAFNRTRDQFASIDTGLDHWIRVTINSHPEHLDTLEQSLKQAGTAPKQSPSTRKFPKLASLGHLTSAPGGSLHVRRPSAHMMNRQQVEQRGKDLLHTAGMLSGRAGGAAKGFFAKGKSKFNRGGAEKVDI